MNQKSPEVLWVNYLGLPDHRSNPVARKQFGDKGCGGVEALHYSGFIPVFGGYRVGATNETFADHSFVCGLIRLLRPGVGI